MEWVELGAGKGLLLKGETSPGLDTYCLSTSLTEYLLIG